MLAGVLRCQFAEVRPQDLSSSLMRAGVPDIKAEIFDSIAADFSGFPEAVDIAARRHLRAADGAEQLQVVKEKLQLQSPT